jgi:hypothetical protein
MAEGKPRSMRLKWIRIPLIALGFFMLALVAWVGYLRAFSGQVKQYSSNPSGTVKAEVMDYSEFASAMDAGALGVSLKTKLNPFRHAVFSGQNHGATIRVAWINDRILFIRCDHCEKLQDPSIVERKWHQTTICYGGSGRPDLLQNSDPLCPQESQ